jgi:hypothetical protein
MSNPINIGRFTQLNNASLDTAFNNIYHVSDISKILPNEKGEYHLLRFSDIFDGCCFAAPKKWGEWSDDPTYPLNCIDQIYFFYPDDVTNVKTPIIPIPHHKQYLKFDFCVVPCIVNTKLPIFVLQRKNITTLPKTLDKLYPNLPLDLVKIIGAYGTHGIYDPPYFQLYVKYLLLNVNERHRISSSDDPDLPETYIPKKLESLFDELIEILPTETTITECSFNFFKIQCEDSLNVQNSEKYYLFYIRKKDIGKISKIKFNVGGIDVLSISTEWLLVNNDKNNSEYFVLPIPPVFGVVWNGLKIVIYKHYEEISPVFNHSINLYCQISPFQLDPNFRTVPYLTLDRCLVQIQQGYPIEYNNRPQSRTELKFHNSAFKLLFVLMYNGQVCERLCPKTQTIKKTTTRIVETDTEIKTEIDIVEKTIMREGMERIHPFKKLTLFINDNVIITEGSAEYYSNIMPIMYGQNPNEKYMVYQMIFHNTPPILPYDYNYMNTSVSDYLTFPNSPYDKSTINFSRIDNTTVVVDWDEEILEEYFPEKNKISLLPFCESVNIIGIRDGLASIRYGR